MSYTELCLKCRESFTERRLYPQPNDHCHHEEKEKCWCEYDRPRKKLKSFEDGEVDLNFCPECGRKL